MAKAVATDICVIGAGPAGLAVARGAASYGVDVVLVDRALPESNIAGGALSFAAVSAAAAHVQAMRDAEKFGLKPADIDADFSRIMARARTVPADAAADVSPERLATLGVTMLVGEARFTGRRRLQAGETEIRARRYVLATGAVPVIPSMPGLEDAGFLTPDTALRLESLPKHLIILGADAEGLALAQLFRRLGSDVTVIALNGVLPAEDPEMSAVIQRCLHCEGVVIEENISVTAVEKHGDDGVRLLADVDGNIVRIDGDRLLISLGRKVDASSLDLKKARVSVKDDAIDVSAMMRTTNRRIYAIGDASGSRSIQSARRQADMVLKSLIFRLPAKDRATVPRVVQTDPPLAHVGLTEAEAMRRHRGLTIIRRPFSESDRACADRQTAGHIKIVVARSGEVLGVTIAGSGATGMIGMWTLVVSGRLKLSDVATLILPYPDNAEIGKKAAMTYSAGRTKGRLLRSWVRLLQFLG